ncbi:chaperonin GroES [Galdieria sulphuraria]|uniref:20 kDa chaperonin, chloroplastic n=1 Tax=Galdieria sulphuraria TaxID=130081 RepID=M2X640_GALSU|nr:chaperonin GroES [Galdieria sulphuraria]EME31960.1 chaperonin GroES [Galdieria sulphuraria]|eukprot:XP_005708480.1 chaperonin GroES [Galdieria sulphuraria]
MDTVAFTHSFLIRTPDSRSCSHLKVCHSLSPLKVNCFRDCRRRSQGQVSLGRLDVCNRTPLSYSFSMVAQSEIKHRINGFPASRDLVPLRNYVLVKFATPEEQTSSGLLIARSSSDDQAVQGTVVAVGPGSFLPKTKARGPLAVQPGDFILAGKYGGQRIDIDGHKHFLLSQEDILCTLQGGKKEVSSIKPIFDRVVLKKIKSEQETASGIVIAASNELPTIGEVVAVGPGRLLDDGQYEPIELSVGDHVVYSKYSGNEYRFGGDDYIIVRASDCVAKW